MLISILKWANYFILIVIAAAWVISWITIIATRVDVGDKTERLKAVGTSFLWPAVFYLRAWLIIVGLFFIPLTFIADGKHRTPRMWQRVWGSIENVPAWWKRDHGDTLRAAWWWMAVRNPTQGMATWWDQPVEEPRPNPDNLVYGGDQKSAARYLRHDGFSEIWYLRAVKEKKFEVRIGFKYADGSPGFLPTISIRYGN